MRADLYVADPEGRVLSNTVTSEFEITGGRMVNLHPERLLHVHSPGSEVFLVIVSEDMVLARTPLGTVVDGFSVSNEEWRFVLD